MISIINIRYHIYHPIIHIGDVNMVFVINYPYMYVKFMITENLFYIVYIYTY